nr:hypothetical protein [Pseudomonas aeruginosa]
MLQRHYFCHDLNRAFPIEALARSVELVLSLLVELVACGAEVQRDG